VWGPHVGPYVVITAPPVGERSIAISVSVCQYVCLFVCPLAYVQKLQFKFHELLCICYLWPWLGPFLTTKQYVMYFRSSGRRNVST